MTNIDLNRVKLAAHRDRSALKFSMFFFFLPFILVAAFLLIIGLVGIDLP